MRLQRRAGFRRLVAGGRISNLLLVGPELSWLLFLSNLVELVGEQSSVLHDFIISGCMLDGKPLRRYLRVMTINLCWTLMRLLLGGGF